MKTPKLMEQRAGKRSPGKQGRKKFPFSSREIANPRSSLKVVGKKPLRCQSRLQLELMKTELVKMKGQIMDSSESLLAAKIEADQTEAKLELLITTRNEMMDNLLEMKATEAFLMLLLGFL
ncbi:hypothetical protein CRYUN_Cryun08bG0038000 [Craigia yunnanensis]